MKKINVKLNMMLLGSILVMGICLTVILVPTVMNAMRSQMQAQSLNLAQTQLNSIENYTQSTVDELTLMSKVIDLSNVKKAASTFQTIQSTDSRFVSAALSTQNGTNVITQQSNAQDPLFQMGVQKGTYIGAVQKTIGANFSIPMSQSILNQNGQVTGVIENQLSIGDLWMKLRNIVDFSKVKMDPYQSVFLVSKDGYILATDNMNAVQKQFQKNGSVKKGMIQDQAFEQMAQQVQKTHNFKPVSGYGLFKESDGKSYYVAYAYSPLIQAAVFVKTSKTLIMTPILHMVALILGLVAASFIIIGFAGFIFARRMTAPINQLVDLTQRVSEGDLTRTLTLKRSDEFGVLAAAFNQMVTHLKSLVSKSQEASDKTVEASQFLQLQALDITHASEQVAQSMNEIASGAEQQSQLSQETESAITEFLGMSETIDQKNHDVLAQAHKTQVIIADSQEALTSLIDGVCRLSKSTEESKVTVEELRSTALQISSIVKDTNAIAEQTNLLSLNAAIEAARAGEAGKGFSVVAQEIRKLSEASQESASRIQQIIKLVLSSIDNACAQMEETLIQSEKEQQTANHAATALPAIDQSMNQVVETVQDIEGYFKKQKDILQDILDHAKQASQVAMTTSAGVEEVAATSQQTNDNMQSVLSQIIELNQLALTLKTAVQEFQIHD